MSTDIAKIVQQQQPDPPPRRWVAWLTLPVVVTALAFGYWRADVGQLRGDLADSLTKLDRGRSLRGPALIEFGNLAAPFVAVVAWNPQQPASNRRLLDLADWVERDADQVAGGVRLVVLPSLQPGGDTRLLAQLLGLHRGEDLLETVRALGDHPLTGARLCAHWGAKTCEDLAKASAIDDLEVAARALQRIAAGVGLAPGDVLLNGHHIAAKNVSVPGLIEQRWQADVTRIALLVQRLGSEPGPVQEQFLKDAATPALNADRYLHWIVRHLRMKTT